MREKRLLHRINKANGEFYAWAFWCPGCKDHHLVGPQWEFDGNEEQPTFAPSILVRGGHPKVHCHSFVRNGQIQFLSDCNHELAGKTVTMELCPCPG